MKRITSILAVTAVALGISALAYAEEPAATSTAKSTPATMTSPAVHHMKKMTREPAIDLNSATREDLMKLPGVGDATADKIIAARPFKSKAELLSKKLVTRKEYSKLRAHVIAKQESKQVSAK